MKWKFTVKTYNSCLYIVSINLIISGVKTHNHEKLTNQDLSRHLVSNSIKQKAEEELPKIFTIFYQLCVY